MVLRSSGDAGRNLESLDRVLQLLALVEVILGLTNSKSVDGFGLVSMLDLEIPRLASSLGVLKLGTIKLGNFRLGKIKLGIFRLGNGRLGSFRMSSRLGIRPKKLVHGE
jgi:hypothetical protein